MKSQEIHKNGILDLVQTQYAGIRYLPIIHSPLFRRVFNPLQGTICFLLLNRNSRSIRATTSSPLNGEGRKEKSEPQSKVSQPLVRETLGKPISRADRFPSSHVRVRLLSPLILFLPSSLPLPHLSSFSPFVLLLSQVFSFFTDKGSLVRDNKLRKQWWNERWRVEEADLAKVYYIHFTGKRPIYLIIRNLHNGQLACLVYTRSPRIYTRNGCYLRPHVWK